MKRLILLLLFIPFITHAQLISFGQQDSLYSNTLKENRPLWIYTPTSIDDTAFFQRAAYPVIYVLDGNSPFATLQTMIQALAVNEGNMALPQMIIVGILNTPGNRTKNMAEKPEELSTFFEKELFPYIEGKYPTAPYRILIGHSLGGLYATNTLLHHRDLFNAYIASDPSFWYNNAAFLKEAPPLLKQDFSNRQLFIAMAHTINPAIDSSQVHSDTSLGGRHTSAILDLTYLLKKANNHLRWDYKYYPDDDHHTVPFIAVYDGLRFIFPHHRFPTYLYTDDSSPDSLKTLVVNHYKLLSKEMGYTVRPPEWFLNQMGYWNLMDKRYAKSATCFQLNIDYYPESYNVYDSMGDYYKEVNDLQNAILSFRKALSLRDKPEIRTKMEKTVMAANNAPKSPVPGRSNEKH
ncbi:alpha/beta hydrolase-fold protein [Chitinophaga silvisoli]|uniref:Alpha/beta hydrolase n=1 Tax=Chitinophaga silvisoli TaxID=2291814 RepID=A0A3E1NYF6_9BACT|nr:alpha/beta hydrolase-fold protein [Chitinophaga silvisoli]RFM32976.1 alpha/beta hydrolase [Chitinophaga silvisoli]